MRLILASLALATLAQPVAAQEGAAIYRRCAACHLPTGAGVPGAYPPLAADFRNLTATPGGRRYLALSVIKGVAGPIKVDGKPYRGVMPAQSGLTDEQIAAVLNHVATSIAKAPKTFKPFTPAEVAGYRGGAAKITPSDLGKLHATLGGK